MSHGGSSHVLLFNVTYNKLRIVSNQDAEIMFGKESFRKTIATLRRQDETDNWGRPKMSGELREANDVCSKIALRKLLQRYFFSRD